MFEKLKKNYSALLKTKEFNSLKKEKPEIYLCSAFTVMEGKEFSEWQLDFFDTKDNKITSFILKNGKFEMTAAQEVFQEKESKIDELELGKVKLNLEETFEIIKKVRDEKYRGDNPSKIIIILQNMDNHEVWNVTYLTVNFNVLNFKIDASNGAIISEKCEPVFGFKVKA
ncbi:hypothetical protein J4468_01730 [Candidatus Woesearchaeota archaeon]|nr:hypothetical protein [Candidatus Woesearchaeota archaeon]